MLELIISIPVLATIAWFFPSLFWSVCLSLWGTCFPTFLSSSLITFSLLPVTTSTFRALQQFISISNHNKTCPSKLIWMLLKNCNPQWQTTLIKPLSCPRNLLPKEIKLLWALTSTSLNVKATFLHFLFSFFCFLMERILNTKYSFICHALLESLYKDTSPVWYLPSIIWTVRNNPSTPKVVAPRNWNSQCRECSLSQLALIWFTICQHFLLYLSSACQKQLMVNKREEEYARFYSWFIKSYDPEKKKKKSVPTAEFWFMFHMGWFNPHWP